MWTDEMGKLFWDAGAALAPKHSSASRALYLNDAQEICRRLELVKNAPPQSPGWVLFQRGFTACGGCFLKFDRNASSATYTIGKFLFPFDDLYEPRLYPD
jgi:hypothetical protein